MRRGGGMFAWLAELVGSPRYLVYALLVHVAFFAVLVVSLEWTVTPAPPPAPNVIQAVAVDEARLQAEMEKLRLAEERERQRALEAKQAAERKRREEERRLAELKKKQEAEKKRLAELQKKKEAERRRQVELERKRKEEAARRAREEERRKEEAARRAALEREQKELERKRKEEEARRRAAAERELQERLAAEQRRLEAERERKLQSVVARYVEIIKQRVERFWLRPPNSRSGLFCEVRVRLIPGGEVVGVQIVRSSGDPAFDASVEKAVLRASPLPLPEDPALFERFRELKFIFKPED